MLPIATLLEELALRVRDACARNGLGDQQFLPGEQFSLERGRAR